jgi:FixJ family two-component response regulator
MLLSTLQTTLLRPIQPANPTRLDSHELSRVAYIVTDEGQLGADVSAITDANGIRAKWFRSASGYLDYQRPEVPSCLLISLRLSNMSGLDFQRMLAGTITPPIILVSDDGDIPSCVCAMREGAHDFLTLPLVPSHLLNTMNAAFRKDTAALVVRQEREGLRKRWRSLTSREAEVMRYVVGGFLNKQTAAELSITENTVQVHRGRVMRKMRADSFATLVRMSLKLADWGEDSLFHTADDQTVGGHVSVQ